MGRLKRGFLKTVCEETILPEIIRAIPRHLRRLVNLKETEKMATDFGCSGRVDEVRMPHCPIIGSFTS